ncbi:hypothetical protein ACFQT0_16860 [Hymenobacter humi]|uniref:Uncharacterized protein n=1 Tax=Hymenobacter humi TaxID=1411620 RepID=A0ABW2U8X4_9BACT
MTLAQAREFVQFPVRLYAGDPNYVRPLDNDIAAVFDRDKNKYFRHGDLIRWLLVDEAGRTLGRVAAFINERTANTFAQPTGGMGFLSASTARKPPTRCSTAAAPGSWAKAWKPWTAPSISGTATSGGVC